MTEAVYGEPCYILTLNRNANLILRGYSGSLGISLSGIRDASDSETQPGEELFDGHSRQFMAGEFSPAWTDGEWPHWLKRGDAKLLSTETQLRKCECSPLFNPSSSKR